MVLASPNLIAQLVSFEEDVQFAKKGSLRFQSYEIFWETKIEGLHTKDNENYHHQKIRMSAWVLVVFWEHANFEN